MRLDFIETRSGRRVRPLHPEASVICIDDIAHHLSNQCRFSGATVEHYSVAEHCFRVSHLLETWGCSRLVQLEGLLHDASETWLQDVPSPVKHAPEFAFYRDAERRWEYAVAEVFGLPRERTARVTRADLVMLSTEARDLMPFRKEHWGSLEHAPLPNRIIPWPPYAAKNLFLARFKELTQ